MACPMGGQDIRCPITWGKGGAGEAGGEGDQWPTRKRKGPAGRTIRGAMGNGEARLDRRGRSRPWPLRRGPREATNQGRGIGRSFDVARKGFSVDVRDDHSGAAVMTRLLFGLCRLLGCCGTNYGSVHVTVKGFDLAEYKVGGNPMGGFHETSAFPFAASFNPWIHRSVSRSTWIPASSRLAHRPSMSPSSKSESSK